MEKTGGDAQAQLEWILEQIPHPDRREEAQKLLLPAVEASAELARLREHLQLISEGSFEGLIGHAGGEVFLVNQRLCQILGYEEEELLRLGVIQAFFHPDDRPELTQKIRSGYEGAYTIRGLRKDGSNFEAELQSRQSRWGERPVRIVALRDVSEREKTMHLLRESEQRFRALSDAVFAITAFIRDGVIVNITGPLLERMGYQATEFIGRSALDFIASPALPTARSRLGMNALGAYESIMLSKDGEQVPVEIVAIQSSVEGILTRVAGVRDLTEQRRREAERQELQRRVERAQRLDSLGVLSGGIAHDFNNLLVSIMGNAECLLDDAKGTTEKAMLEAILLASERAAGLTRRLLAYAGKSKMADPEVIHLKELVMEMYKVVARAGEQEENFRFEETLDPELAVDGDRAALTQVMLNLITNARDAMPEGGELHISASRVSQPDRRWEQSVGSAVGPGRWIQVEVRDTGRGMDEETMARIFEPFFSTKSAGHGLGLAASLGVVHSHGGALSVSSQPDAGTTFSLLLPASRQDSSVVPTSIGDERVSWRLLLVDDEKLVREQLVRSLGLRGHQIVEASSGPACLQLMEREHFDVVLMDLAMPAMDGAETLRLLRQRGDTTPIVLRSGYVDPPQEKRLSRGSFQGFVHKPFGIEELLAALSRACHYSGTEPSMASTEPHQH